MYADLKESIKFKIKKLNEGLNFIEVVEKAGINLDIPNTRHWINLDGSWTIEINNNYATVKDILRILAKLCGESIPFNMSWPSGSKNKIMFSWENDDFPLKVWASFPYDQIPEELTKGCEVKEVEITTKVHRLVCDV